MKKINLLFLLLLCFIITGCTSNVTKEAKSITDFENICTSNGFSVTDNMSEYSDVDYVSGAKVATLDNVTIQMVVYADNENAEKVSESHSQTFTAMKGSGSVINKHSGTNYYRFDMISNGYYMISSRIDNTLIFVKTQVENKDIVDTIFNGLDY